jgi:hypothetical protein
MESLITQNPTAKSSKVTFWEIFTHSWRILWEKPKSLLVFIVALSIIRYTVDYISNNLLEPYIEPLLKLSSTQVASTEEAGLKMFALFNSLGVNNFFWGLILPWLFAPLTFLASCRVSLGLWDGYSPGLSDLLYSAKHYLKSALIMFLLFLYGIALSFLLLAILMPALIFPSIVGRTPGGWFLSMIGLFISAYLFANFLWPQLRRFVPLQFIIFFKLIDGLRTEWINNLTKLYREFLSFPSHMNQSAIIILCFIIVPVFALGLVNRVSSNLNFFPEIVVFISQTIYTLIFLWPIVALAGFYRLCITPLIENNDPISNNNEATIENS